MNLQETILKFSMKISYLVTQILEMPTSHLSLMPTVRATDPPPAITPPLCTVGWFAKTHMFVYPKTQKYFKTQKIVQTCQTKKGFISFSTLARPKFFSSFFMTKVSAKIRLPKENA